MTFAALLTLVRANTLRASAVAVLVGALPPAAVAQDASAPAGPATAVAETPSLITFQIPKPAGELDSAHQAQTWLPPLRTPRASDSIRTSVGLGYVQGADWGLEIQSAGAIAGWQLQLNTLMTQGSQGLRFDYGTGMLSNPASGWRIEAGDIFSNLRGAAVGGRVSWDAAGNRRPSLAVYADRSVSAAERRTVLAYRDQIRWKEQTLLDAELATDRSFLLRHQLNAARLNVEASMRSQRSPFEIVDHSVSASVPLVRGVHVGAGFFKSSGPAIDDDEWRTISIRVPLAKFMDLTLERAFAGASHSEQRTSAAMVNVSAGGVRFFHRFQSGEYDLQDARGLTTLERQQSQSMASYNMGRRASLTVQLATQRSDNGRTTHWEELHSQVQVTPRLSVRTVTAVPDIADPERFQIYARQELRSGFALQADYGRISAYQPVPAALDRQRLKVMVFKTLNLATPAGGAELTGRVLDYQGRGVAGARVRVGAFTAETNGSGAYRISHLPAGEYRVSLIADQLPASFAWDGREQLVTLTPRAHAAVDLRATPLNSLVGHVFVDRNGNRRVDAGEGITGAVVAIGERITASDEHGAYGFSNLAPGDYLVRIVKMPSGYQLADQGERSVNLTDTAPLVGIDFAAVAVAKPIRWETSLR